MDEDLSELARKLGFCWPDDEEGRWRVLKLMAQSAAHWRREVSKCQSELWPAIERERIFKLKGQRVAALSRQLRNVRRALRDYMASQSAFVREGLAEIRYAEFVKLKELLQKWGM